MTISSEFPRVRLSLQLGAGATMVGLKPAQRRVLVTHLPELANIAAGSLLFGQFLTERPYSPLLAVVGVTLWVVFTGAACVLAASEGS